MKKYIKFNIIITFIVFLVNFLMAEDTINIQDNKILATAHQMAIVEKKIIIGSCYDFVNAVYLRAGFPPKQRKLIFHSPKRGPFADIDLIQPGDWVMHINIEYHLVEHSTIFVDWIDKRRRIALTMNYVGMKRQQPGKYSRHTLSRVFGIIRPK